MLFAGITTILRSHPKSGIPKANIHAFPSRERDAFANAHQLFDELPDRNVKSATALIGHYAKQKRHGEAVSLFPRMLSLDIRPNEFTFGTVIHSSTAIGDLNLGRQLHGIAVKMGLNHNVYVGSAILDFYAKLSFIEDAKTAFEETHEPNVVSYTTLMHGYLKKERFKDARQLFDEMPDRNVISWNAMIGGFSQSGQNEDAVNLFIEMLRDGWMPNESTFPCVISAAANIAALGMGKSFHACAVKCLGSLNVFVGNSLISFYAKCGSMEDSLVVFDELHEKNIVSWNAVVCGYAQNGMGEEAIAFYERMKGEANVLANDVTLLGLLWACNHSGLVDTGFLYFNQAKDNHPALLKPEHYACMVDLLSRSGRFKEAQEFLNRLPFEPGIGFWKALLGGCQIHSNKELGKLAATKIMELDPEDVSSFVMLSNAHCAAGRWQNAITIRRDMKEKRMKRVPGCSWIDIRGKVSVFVNRDLSHCNKDEIYRVLHFFILHASDIHPHKL